MKNNMERIKAESEDLLKCPFCGAKQRCALALIEMGSLGILDARIALAVALNITKV